jgi:hypothetical protein
LHLLIANVTIDPERSEALAMSYGEMLQLRGTLDYRIHNNLARFFGPLAFGGSMMTAEKNAALLPLAGTKTMRNGSLLNDCSHIQYFVRFNFTAGNL